MLYYSTLTTLMSKKIKLDIFLEEYDSDTQLPAESLMLINQARDNCKKAYAPYSNFLVGAVALLENGKIVSGSNQENAASPSGLCAERVALFAAAARYPGTIIKKLAVSATKQGQNIYQTVTPCGCCRQAISEYQTRQNQPIEIIMEGHGGSIQVARSIDMLLPFKFSFRHLD